MDIKSAKIDLDELYTYKKQCTINTIKSYNKIIERIHTRIKTTSRLKVNNECCWFPVPEIELGTPKYDVTDCIKYIIAELIENGFKVKYTHPNLLFIAWNHWVPDYVRNEYKKQTGVAIDGHGQQIKKEDKEFLLKPAIKQNPLYKPVASYVPSGKLNYTKEMFP